MRRFWLILSVVLLLAYGTSRFSGPVPVRASSHLPAVDLKKTCHTVTKKVHGKKKRVRVCKTVKPKPTPTPTPTPIVPPAPRILATIPCSCGGSMTSAFGSVWVNRDPGATTPSRSTVTRIDPTTNTVSARIPVDQLGGEDIAGGFGSIWEVDYGSGTVTRIDPHTNTIVAVVPTKGTSPIGVAVSPQAVWVANHNEPAVPDGANVAKIDPSTNSVVDTVPVGGQQGGPGPLLYSAGSIWAFNQLSVRIDRIDPVTDQVVASIPTRGQGIQHHFAGDGVRVWVSAPGGDDEVQQVDPANNTLKTLVPTNALLRYGVTDIYGLQYGDGSLWLNGPCGRMACLLKIDPDTGAISAAWSMAVGDPNDPGFDGVFYADGSIWVGAGPPDAPSVLRLDVSS